MATLGEELRKQRELRQISLREISDATKINIRFLEALERDDYTHLPGGQFNKGFIRAYSRHIGIDPEKLVDAYMEELQRRDEPIPSVEGERVASAPPVGPVGFATPATPLFAAVGAVLVAGSLLIAWLFVWQPSGSGKSAHAAPSLPPPAPSGPLADVRQPVEPARAESMNFELTCLRPVSTKVLCDGAVIYEGELRGGDLRTARCEGEIRVTVGHDLVFSVRPAEAGSAAAGAGAAGLANVEQSDAPARTSAPGGL